VQLLISKAHFLPLLHDKRKNFSMLRVLTRCQSICYNQNIEGGGR